MYYKQLYILIFTDVAKPTCVRRCSTYISGPYKRICNFASASVHRLHTNIANKLICAFGLGHICCKQLQEAQLFDVLCVGLVDRCGTNWQKFVWCSIRCWRTIYIHIHTYPQLWLSLAFVVRKVTGTGLELCSIRVAAGMTWQTLKLKKRGRGCRIFLFGRTTGGALRVIRTEQAFQIMWVS